MKRFLWLMCIGCCSATFSVGCGDDDGGGGGGMGDGGVDINDQITDLNEDITGLEGDLGDLDSKVTDGLADLNTQLDGLDVDLGGLSGDVDGLQSQIEDLITPDNCSVEELCIPNGVQATAAALASLMTTLCEKEFDCCDENERAVRLGVGVEDVGDCVKHMVDAIENGQSPDLDLFWYADDIIDGAIAIATAINSNDVQVGIDAAKIAECDEQLQDIECNGEGEEEEPAEFCETVDYEEEEDPCSPEAIVIGLQEEGEICGLTDVNECADGLRCRGPEFLTALPNGATGICMPPAAVGDACNHDNDCDGTEQYCDHETNSCAERGDVGDPCEYIDPSFEINNGLDLSPGWEGWLQNPGAMKHGCKTGLSCDPESEECVDNCTEHTICSGNWQCPEDTVCNFTEIPELYETWSLGFCTDPIEEGEPCTWQQDLPNFETLGTECGTQRCAEISVDGPECVAERTEDGGDCDDAVDGPAIDQTCASSRCNANGECATLCSDEDHTCPDDYFCDTDAYAAFDEGMHPCEPVGGTGDDCAALYDTNEDNSQGTDVSCASGRCDTVAGTCAAAKLGNGDPCTHDADCPAATHFCGYDTTDARDECMPFVAPAGNCGATGGTDWDCGPNAQCSEGTCVSEAGEGDDCAVAPCESTLTCALFPGDATYACHWAGDFPNGANCNFTLNCPVDEDGIQRCLHDVCASGFCNQPNGYICDEPIEAGEECDADDPAAWYCEEGYYCKHDPGADDDDIGKGECTRQRSVGQSCEPRYDQMNTMLNVHDCQGEQDEFSYSDNCDLIGDEFVCNNNSREDDLMCDGA